MPKATHIQQEHRLELAIMANLVTFFFEKGMIIKNH